MNNLSSLFPFWLLFFVFGLGFSSTSFAITISVSSGVSQPSFIQDKTVKIYAGWANAATNCVGRGSTETCDTCLGGDSVPCNHQSIHGGLYLQIDVSSTTANIGGLPVQLSATSDTIQPLNVVPSTSTSSGYSLRILWRDLCSGMFGTGSSDCNETSPIFKTMTLYFGPVKDSRFVEAINLEVNLSVLGGTQSNYTPCPSGATGSEAAACHYEMFGGDEKVYVSVFEPGWNIDTPSVTVGSTVAPVRSVVFFAAQSADNSAAAQSAAFNTITSSSDFFELGVKAGEDPLDDNRLNDLTNGTVYCFKMATQDITGNILKFTPSTAYSAESCAEPNDVAGILADKNCFIATAAFGSSLNRHVQRFRDFRNQFLVRNEWGEKFIKLYYQYGPQAATVIREHQSLRTMTRAALWPLLVFVEISLRWGILWGVFSVLLSLLVLRRSYQLLKLRFLPRPN